MSVTEARHKEVVAGLQSLEAGITALVAEMRTQNREAKPIMPTQTDRFQLGSVPTQWLFGLIITAVVGAFMWQAASTDADNSLATDVGLLNQRMGQFETQLNGVAEQVSQINLRLQTDLLEIKGNGEANKRDITDAQGEISRMWQVVRDLEQKVVAIRSSRFTEEDGIALERRLRALELRAPRPE